MPTITYAGVIYEDREAPKHVLQAEVERLRPLANPDTLSLVASNVRAERARIRLELLESFILAFGDGYETRHLVAALDRICPEEP